MIIKVRVEDGPIHMNSKLARELEECFHALAHRCGKWPDERPRSRTQSGLLVAHKGTMIYLDLARPSSVKVIKPLEGAKK